MAVVDICDARRVVLPGGGRKRGSYYELHRQRLHLGPEEEALVDRDLELGDDEEVPVMDTPDVEAVLMRLDVLREQQGDEPAGENEAAEAPVHEPPVAANVLNA